jgi:hypothetical protein
MYSKDTLNQKTCKHEWEVNLSWFDIITCKYCDIERNEVEDDT